MRKISEIIIHCTDTPENKLVTAEEIRAWHRNRGFVDMGYHFIIHQNGNVEKGRPIERAGAHCYNHNAHSIGIAYVGGRNIYGHADTRTLLQKQAMTELIMKLRAAYGNLEVHGHNFYNHHKECPCFNVEEEYGFINCINEASRK